MVIDRKENLEKIDKTLRKLQSIIAKMETRELMNTAAGDISPAEIRTMETIGIGNEKTMSQVSEELDVSVSTLTTAINKLVKKQYVERFRIPSDRRIVKIRLTESGEEAVRIRNDFHMEVMERVMEGFSDFEMSRLAAALYDIDEYLNTTGAEPIREYEEGAFSDLKIGGRVLPKALFQGAISIGGSMSGLASAVAKEGGMGVIAAMEIGYAEKDHKKEPLRANLRVLIRELDKAKRELEKEKEKREEERDEAVAKAYKSSGAKEPVGFSSPDELGMIAVNIPYSTEDYREYVMAAVANGADAIISGSGLAMSLPGIVKDRRVLLIPIISSVRAAVLIMRGWQKKHGRLPDAFIFSDAYSGGIMGYKDNQVFTGQKNFYQTIVDIKEQIGDIPLIVAGGISGATDARRVYEFGADGIQCGSLFITTKECDIHKDVKRAYLNCTENDVTIIKDLQGRPCRAINTGYVAAHRDEGNFDINKGLIAAAKGDMKDAIIGCGAKAFRQTEISSVKDVFRELLEG